MTFRQNSCEVEVISGRSRRSEQVRMEEENTTSVTSRSSSMTPNVLVQESLSLSTQESPRPNKRKISCVNATTLSSFTPNTLTSIPMLGVVSTLKGRVLGNFWNSSAKDWSKRLSCPTKTDLQELDSTALSKSSLSMEPKSWFTTKIYKMKTDTQPTSSLSSLALSQVITENVLRNIESDDAKRREVAEVNKRAKLEKAEEIRAKGIQEEEWDDIMLQVENQMKFEEMLESYNDECGMTKKQIRGKITRCSNAIKRIENKFKPPSTTPILSSNSAAEKVEKIYRAKKTKILPNEIERNTLKAWFGASRFVYNRCVAHCRDIELDKFVSSAIQKQVLRDYVRGDVTRENLWLNELPSEIVDNAVIQFVNAYQASLAKLKKALKANETFDFKMRFMSKQHMLQETISVEARAWSMKAGNYGFLKHIKCYEGLPATVKAQVKVSRTRIGTYYIAFPSPVEISKNNAPFNVIALDPGDRTFVTGYVSDGFVIEWGSNDKFHLRRLLRHADSLQGRIKKSTGQHKRAMRLAWHRMLRKVKNRVDYFHKRLCKFLVTSFKVILLPLFNVSRLVKRSTRKIGPSVTRSIHVWSHFRFRELLKAKVITATGCILHICDENFTTKLCTRCGFDNNNVGSLKEYTCPKCNMQHCRDVSAARNILIRYLVKHEITITNPTITNLFTYSGPSGLAHTSLEATQPALFAKN